MSCFALIGINFDNDRGRSIYYYTAPCQNSREVVSQDIDVAYRPDMLGLINYRTTYGVIRKAWIRQKIHFRWQRSSSVCIKVPTDQLRNTAAADAILLSYKGSRTHPKPIRINVCMSIIADYTTSIPHGIIFRSENSDWAVYMIIFHSDWAVLPLLIGSEVSM